MSYYERHTEERLEYQKMYNQTNREIYLEKQKDYYNKVTKVKYNIPDRGSGSVKSVKCNPTEKPTVLLMEKKNTSHTPDHFKVEFK